MQISFLTNGHILALNLGFKQTDLDSFDVWDHYFETSHVNFHRREVDNFVIVRPESRCVSRGWWRATEWPREPPPRLMRLGPRKGSRCPGEEEVTRARGEHHNNSQTQITHSESDAPVIRFLPGPSCQIKVHQLDWRNIPSQRLVDTEKWLVM